MRAKTFFFYASITITWLIIPIFVFYFSGSISLSAFFGGYAFLLACICWAVAKSKKWRNEAPQV